MKPWLEMQFKLEELLTRTLLLNSEDAKIKELGDCLIANILVCKEIDSKKESQLLWSDLEKDLNEVFEMSVFLLNNQSFI